MPVIRVELPRGELTWQQTQPTQHNNKEHVEFYCVSFREREGGR